MDRTNVHATGPLGDPNPLDVAIERRKEGPGWAGGLRLVAVLLALAMGHPAFGQDQASPIKIGVLARRGAERCLEKWTPTAAYLTGQIPECSFIIVPLGFEEVCPAVERGEVDFALVNPSMYVEIEARCGANALATLISLHFGVAYTRYGGVIFHRANRADIKCLEDLKGKSFMAVAEASFGGWRMAWRELKEAGIDVHRDFADLRFAATHDAVVYAVRDGLVDAGTVRTDILEEMEAEGKIRLQELASIHKHGGPDVHLPVFHSTRPYPEWPFVKLAHASDKLAEKVTLALLSMPADSPAAKAAGCTGWTVPLNYQPVHECLKELRVEPYEDFGTVTLSTLMRQYRPWLAAIIVFLALAAITTLYVLRLNRGLNRSRLDLSRELSERRRVQAELRAASRYALSLIEASLDPLATINVDDKITDINQAMEAVTGVSRERLIGSDFSSHVTEPEKAREVYLRVLREGPVKDYPLTVRHTSGRVTEVLYNATVYENECGEAQGVLAAARDITERKRTEQAARTAQQQLLEQQRHEKERVQVELNKVRKRLVSQTRLATIGQVSASIAHDLRNPLGVVRNAAYHLKRRLGGKDPRFAEYLGIIDEEVAAADRIISGLMDMTRAREPVKELVNLGRVVEEALGRINRAQQIRCRMSLDPDPFTVSADLGQLQQVFGNMVNNAVEAMGSAGEILVTARRSADCDTIMLEDRGPGISPEIRESVFEPLFTTNAKGTGLGLTICRQIIERHGGTIDLVDGTQHGAAFRIRLPR
ncbi:MAG: PhnD/SsuA/transferrin family substrate-binding protein [Candidatus Eisenbacteria sp.]|nr:PhnD/SsuA/transferrin family substrate-binding protein [Candidatus Eisenbacteria bacterium]